MDRLNTSSRDEITVLWLTAGLGCDGESVAITAATQPSIEDIVMGGLPGIPKEIENQYGRAVERNGNRRALEVLSDVFEPLEFFEWRGLGSIAHSGMKLKTKYAAFDAELKWNVPGLRVADPKACHCGEILKGVKKPWECKVFGTACTPETPIGSCMVSSEGACAAYYNFGRLSKVAQRSAQI